ncbi:hypothetical protein HMPREF1624_03552 [Sporothrix schenckii ATCC 58251]|uniref:VLRF1 domain-containing protein n=1 Tax=Sporothrix schenckii (strain ATCC 58251 / de Perez 2211183) TaxID=1391915 RepID=U7PX61_SPOS1|nr:hypothetical protein HMPREF1624_03552 [Sporothrix schenckii ATCC 58251]
MADRKEEFLRRPLYMFGLPADVLSTLAPVPKDRTIGVAALSYSSTPGRSNTPGLSEATDAAPDVGSDVTVSGEACALCNLAFASHADKRDHFKSDLHLFNLKQKLAGKPPVSEDEFERLVGTLDESISGSEWSESDSLSDLEEEEDGDNDENDTKSVAGSVGSTTTTTSTNTNVLASLLKKQAVLAEKKKKRRSQRNDDGDSGSDAGGTTPVSQPKTHKQRQREAATAASLHALIWFSSPLLPANSYFGVYRAMFTAEELSPPADPATGHVPAEEDEVERSARLLKAVHSRQLPPMQPPPNNAAADKAAVTYAGRHVFMCMLGGGHVAAMVVALAPRKAKAGTVPMNREATVLAHKTFHRYTTRRKQGGSQSANDASKGAAHSAGSTLRRYNEKSLVEDVRALLRDWKPLLDSADLLFVRASGTANQRTLFGPYEGQVLQRNDPRLRSFPFNTRRPTQKEVMRCFIELTRLKVREIVPGGGEDTGSGGDSGTQAVPPPAAALTAEQRLQRQQERREAAKRAEAEETALMHTTQLQALARRSKVPALLAYLKAHGLEAATYRFAPPGAAQHHHAPTLLHYAASQNAPALVSALLLRADADPTVTNGDGKTPFELAGDRPTRDAFRVARGELSSASKPIDWDAARVPSAMTRAEADERESREKAEAARKETERRRAEETRLKEEAAAEKAASANSGGGGSKRLVGVLKSAQEIREEEARGLTPEQRQRLERERRARAAEARLRQMQQGK